MVDVERVLKNTVKKGTVQVGTKQTKNAVTSGKAKLVIIATNCPHADDIISLATKKKIPVYAYTNNSVDLGVACGKKFPVSVFAVLDDADANVMQLVKKK